VQPSTSPIVGRPAALPPCLLDPDRAAPGLANTDALVVEDDDSAVDVAEGLLRMLGYRTRVARDGHAALYEVSRRIPDFILLDIHLPEMDGISFLKVLRKVREAKDVPVVAVSAVYPPDGPVARILEGLGVSQYLSKPFNLEGLRTAIATAHPAGPLSPPEPSALDGPFREWGLPCTGWLDGRQLRMIVDGARPDGLHVLAAPGALSRGVTCRLEVTVRRIVRDAMNETIVRLLVRVTGPAGRKASSERWHLEVQATRPADGLSTIIRALAD